MLLLPFVAAGVVLHFKIPVIKDYYIIDPQRWFDLCSLVISPDNVSSLVRAAGRPGGKTVTYYGSVIWRTIILLALLIVLKLMVYSSHQDKTFQ